MNDIKYQYCSFETTSLRNGQQIAVYRTENSYDVKSIHLMIKSYGEILIYIMVQR